MVATTLPTFGFLASFCTPDGMFLANKGIFSAQVGTVLTTQQEKLEFQLHSTPKAHASREDTGHKKHTEIGILSE